MKSNITSIFAFVGATLASAAAFAQVNYPSGHQPLEVFDGAAMQAAPIPLKLWLALMMATFAAGIFFLRYHKAARWAVGGFIAMMATGELVFNALGLPLLSGGIALWHIICWTPALIILLMQRPFLDQNLSLRFRIWAFLMTVIILISFLFDIPDALAYINHFSP